MNTTEQTGDGRDLGVWITVADLAKRKGISRQSAHERVTKLERDGRISTRQEGRSRLVDLASYDRAVGQVGDAAREVAAETRRELSDQPEAKASPATAKLRDAQTERAQYETRLKALDYAERTGQLVPVKGPQGVETGLVRVAEHILTALDMPMRRAGDLIDAVREGEPAFRRVLRSVIRDQRAAIAAALTKIAGDAMDDQAAGVAVDIVTGSLEDEE